MRVYVIFTSPRQSPMLSCTEPSRRRPLDSDPPRRLAPQLVTECCTCASSSSSPVCSRLSLLVVPELRTAPDSSALARSCQSGGSLGPSRALTQSYNGIIRQLQIHPRLGTRLDEPAAQFPCQFGTFFFPHFTLVRPVSLVADENDGYRVGIFDAQDLMPKSFDSLECRPLSDGVDENEAFTFAGRPESSNRCQCD